MMGTKVHQVMTDSPRCVTPETSVSEAAELMETEDVGSLPILDGERLAGVITDRDIVVRAIAKGKDPRGMPVREIATEELVTVQANDDLSDALALMANQQVRRLPVVDEHNRLVGVLAQADVATAAKEKSVGEMVEEISKSPTGPRL
jgi:CBS domain-containing protein